MSVRIKYKNQDECTLRPAPLVSIQKEYKKQPNGLTFGVSYSITLTGTLLEDEGTPYAVKASDETRFPYKYDSSPAPNSVGPYGSFDSNISHFDGGRPPGQFVPTNEKLGAILFKKKALSALFAEDGQKLEIIDWTFDEASIICYPRVVNISFTEGIYVNRCDYSITLEADTLLDKNGNVLSEGSTIQKLNPGKIVEGQTEDEIVDNLSGVFLDSFSESWSIETQDDPGISPELPRSYVINHSVSAVGKDHYGPTGNDVDDVRKREGWEQAKSFVQSTLSDNIAGYINTSQNPTLISSGLLNLTGSYGGFSHSRSENIDEFAGSYDVTETWLVSSGTAYENFSTSIESSIDSAFVSVSIDGNVRGLATIPSSGYPATSGTAYQNALAKYNAVSNSGQFGITSDIYKRANNQVEVYLNSQPLSVGLGTNEYLGEITYSLRFDNRPTNFVSGVLSENISVSDTYPGDTFSVIPVIGRSTGPVLQYTGSRSEYTRNVSLNFLVDYQRIPYTSGRNDILLKKPSLVEPMGTEIAKLISNLSPANEPGVLKYFVSPPQENWNPRTGEYSLDINFTYELDK